MQETDLQVLDLSHNKLTSACCAMLSTALAKPQATRGWGAGGAALGSRKDGGGAGSTRVTQTPAKGFNSSLQELDLSWNSIGTIIRLTPMHDMRLLCLLTKLMSNLHLSCLQLMAGGRSTVAPPSPHARNSPDPTTLACYVSGEV